MARVTRDIPVERLLTKQMSLWEMRRRMSRAEQEELRKEPWHMGYITISRQPGSLGNEIAGRVAELLDWQLFDRELVHRIAISTKMREQVIESLDEKEKNAVKSWVQGIIDSDSISSDRYCHHLVRVVTTIAQHGRAVIVGRGANYVLDPARGLRVRVVAPLNVRIRRLMARENLDEREARNRIREGDNQQIAFARHYFHRDINDMDYYDLMLNTEYLDVEAAAHTIREALIRKFQALRQNDQNQ